MSEREMKIKKPFYKRGWFIGIILLLVISAIFGGGDKTNDNKPTYEYNIIEKEKTKVANFDRYSLRVVTNEKLNKEQIETLLNKIRKDLKYNDKDQVYIFLYEEELNINDSFSLGRLVYKDNEIEINSSEKDWNKQPTKEDYKNYKAFMDKSTELAEKNIFEDSDYIANKVSEEKNIEAETILESFKKVMSWRISGF